MKDFFSSYRLILILSLLLFSFLLYLFYQIIFTPSGEIGIF